MRRQIFFIAALLVCGPTSAQEIGADDVIESAVQEAIRSCLREAGHSDTASVLGCFQRTGVTSDARDLARALIDDADIGMPGLLVAFREAGEVDIAEFFFPNLANTNYQMAFVNTSDGVQLAGDLNFTRNPAPQPSTRAILARYPRAFESGRVSVVAVRQLPAGNQRFVLSDIVTDGCRACEPVATSLRYFDFSDGRFSGVRDLGWQLWQDVSMSQAAERVRRGDVATIQSRLNRMGYDAGPVDGAAGPRTMSAVMAFKRDHCLPENNQIPPEFVSYLAPSSPDFSIPPCAPGASASPSATLPFPDGIYSADARLCPPASLDVRAEFGDRAYRLMVSVEDGSWSWGESNCTIAGVADEPHGFTLDLNCLTEGFSEQTEILLEDANSEGFTYDGREFWQCQAPVSELPIPSGTYAHDNRLCPDSAEHPPNDVAFEAGPRPLYIDGTDLSWADASCEITAARQSGPDWGLDLTCVEGNNYRFQTTRPITILSDTTVIFEGFEREWCGAPVQSSTQETGGDDELPLDLEQGVYAFELAGCPEFDGEARTQREQVAANLRVTLREGIFTQGEQSCPIASFTRVGDQSHLEMECLYGETPVLYRFEMTPLDHQSFHRYDSTYRLCPNSSAQFSDGAASYGAAQDDLLQNTPPLPVGIQNEQRQSAAEFFTSSLGEETWQLISATLVEQYGGGITSNPVFWESIEVAGRSLFDPRIQRSLDNLGVRASYTTSYFLEFDWSSAGEIGIGLAKTFIVGMASSAIEDYFEDEYQGRYASLLSAASIALLEQTYSGLQVYEDVQSGNLVGAVVGVFEQTFEIGQTLTASMEAYSDLSEISTQSLSDSALAAEQILRLQQIDSDIGLELAVEHSSTLRQIGWELMSEETSWNVDYGRKMILISDFLHVAAFQRAGIDMRDYLTEVRHRVENFENKNAGGLGVVGDRLFLRIRDDEYVDFSNETARLLGVTGW